MVARRMACLSARWVLGALGALGAAGCFAVPDVDLPLPEAGVDDGGSLSRDMRADGPIDSGGFEGFDVGFGVDAAPEVGVDAEVDAVDLGAGVCRVADDCALAGATAGCEGGRCVVAACATERYDLDGVAGNGCEYACAPRGELDGCDTFDDDCDGVIDEDAEVCDCADRCAGPRAESMCRGEICVVEVCEGTTYSGDGRAERGCPCDAADLDPREAPIELLPPAPAGARVHYPGDGRPGVGAWFDSADAGRLWAQRFDAEGHPVGEAQALDDFERPVELLAASAWGEEPEVVVRATDDPRTVWRVDPSGRTELLADCGAERCAVALTEDGPVRADIRAQGDREELHVEGEVIAEWGLGGGEGRLRGLACLPGPDCLAAVERGQTWLYARERSDAFGPRTAVAVSTVGQHWAAALGEPGEVRLVRWSPAGGGQAVTLDLGAGAAIERLALVEGADGGGMVFVDDGEVRYARVAPGWEAIDEMAETGGFFGVGRVQAEGLEGEIFHDDALRGWRPGGVVFDGAASGEPSEQSPTAAAALGDVQALVYRGSGGIFGVSLTEPYPPTLLLTSQLDGEAPPATAVTDDALLVAEVAADRVRIATIRPAITRAALPIGEPVDPERTTVALHATHARTLVALAGRSADNEPVVGVARFGGDGALLSLTRTGLVEVAPVLAGPGGLRGAMLATRASFGNGSGILLRRVDDDGALAEAVLGARTFGEPFALAWSPSAERYTLAWLDRFDGGCPRGSGDSGWVAALDADGELVTAPSLLPLPFECPHAIRLTAGAAGVVHALVTTAGERGALLHIGPDGLPVAPPTPIVESDALDEDAALFMSPTGPAAAWATSEATVRLDFVCQGL